MRTVLLGALIGAGLAIVAVGATPDAGDLFARQSECQQAAGPQSGLVVLGVTVDNRYQQVTVVDPVSRAMSVYHVDLMSGEMELRSARDIRWDLQMEYFNGKGLLPPEIRAMLHSR